MSWWIKEHIAVNEDETKQLCSIEADNQTSLPASDQTATAGFIIVRGSSALVLDTGDRYIMNSSGAWIMQPSGVQLDLSGYATTQDLTDGLAAKVTMQQAYGDATAISANSNLNDYSTPGLYFAIVASVSTIANTPYNATGFRLVVEKNTLSGAAVFQTLYPTSRTYLEFYRRVYEGGSWSSWYKFEGTQVVSALQ